MWAGANAEAPSERAFTLENRSIRIPHRHRPAKRVWTRWQAGTLNYGALEKCKELVCRIPHPTRFLQWRKLEFRVNILRWSRGAYVDIRQYANGVPKGSGILLHQDILAVLMPELVAILRQLEQEDQRDPEQKDSPEMFWR